MDSSGQTRFCCTFNPNNWSDLCPCTDFIMYEALCTQCFPNLSVKKSTGNSGGIRTHDLLLTLDSPMECICITRVLRVVCGYFSILATIPVWLPFHWLPVSCGHLCGPFFIVATVHHSHMSPVATCLLWPPVYCGHLSTVATCLLWPPVLWPPCRHLSIWATCPFGPPLHHGPWSLDHCGQFAKFAVN